MRYRAPAGPHVLLAIDPGAKASDARSCGVALAIEGYIVAADHVAASAIYPWVMNRDHTSPLAIICEMPHRWGPTMGSGAGKVRDTVVWLRNHRPREATWSTVRPHRWKGNVPKAIHHRRVAPLLRQGEIPPGVLIPGSAAYQHDTADAVALILWALGRCNRGGVRC